MERRYDDGEYKGHLIRVCAARPEGGRAWSIVVDVQKPDGEWFPSIVEKDHSYEILEVAFATGDEKGRQLIDA